MEEIWVITGLVFVVLLGEAGYYVRNRSFATQRRWCARNGRKAVESIEKMASFACRVLSATSGITPLVVLCALAVAGWQ